jgi:hypothetical protein
VHVQGFRGCHHAGLFSLPQGGTARAGYDGKSG